jgi:periplasmic protein TonB
MLMKPTAKSFTVILLLAGTAIICSSFSTKDKVRTNTIPVNRQDTSPNVSLKTIKLQNSNTDFDLIPPPIEEDSICVGKDEIDIACMCNLEKEAEYPGGTAAWLRFLNKNLRFPADSGGKRISGVVRVNFTIDEYGNVCNVEAVSGAKILGAEAVRVIKKSGKWKPAMLYKNGRHIKSYKTQPIVFRL